MYGKIQDSGLVGIIYLICISAILGQWLAFLTSRASLGPTTGEWLQSEGCCMAGLLFFPVFPQGLLAHTRGLQSLMTMTCLFPDMTGNMPLLKASLVTMNMFLWLEKQSQPCPCCSILCQWDSRLKWPSWDWNFLFFENDQYYLLQWWTYFF